MVPLSRYNRDASSVVEDCHREMKRIRIDIILGSIFGVTMLVVIALFMMSYVPRHSPYSSPDPPIDFNKGWTTSDGETVDADKLSKVIKNAGEPVTISKQLPGVFYNDSYLNFNAKNIDFTVMVDGQIIYGFKGDDPTGQGGLESYFQHVRMDKSYANGTITIQATPAYSDGTSFFADMAICAVDEYGFWYFQRYGFQFLVSALVIFIGILQIVQYFSIPREFHTYNPLALGVTAIAFGIWSAIETQVPMLLVGSITPMLLMIDYICLFLLPYPAMLFFSSIITRRSRVAEYVVFAANVILALAAGICLLLRVLDAHSTLVFVYPLLGILLVCGLAAGIRSAVSRKNARASQRMTPLSMTAVLICVVCAIANFFYTAFFGAFGVDFGFLVRVGMLIMQVILLGEFMARGSKNSRAAAESEAMRKLAYVDALTGIGNRTAFDLACDALEARKDEEGFDFLMVCFDVDDLKTVNDKHGHEAGDKHLIAASRVLKAAFGDVGEVFRIGGDEFDALISGDEPLKQYGEALERLRKLEELHNNENPEIPLRISCGTCLLSETENHTIREVSSKADAAMYKDKVSHKAA